MDIVVARDGSEENFVFLGINSRDDIYIGKAAARK